MLDQRPFRIRQIAGIAQTIPIVFPTVRFRPHRFHPIVESNQRHGITNDSYHSTSLWTDTKIGSAIAFCIIRHDVGGMKTKLTIDVKVTTGYV